MDIEGKVVVKKGESTDLKFTGENKFHLGFSILEEIEGAAKNLGIWDSLPYGLYYGKEHGGSLQFIHKEHNVIGEAMKNWYEKAKYKAETKG